MQIGNMGWEDRGNVNGRQGTDDERRGTGVCWALQHGGTE